MPPEPGQCPLLAVGTVLLLSVAICAGAVPVHPAPKVTEFPTPSADGNSSLADHSHTTTGPPTREPAGQPPRETPVSTDRTLVLANNSLLPGNPSLSRGGHPAQEVFDPSNDLVYASDQGLPEILVLNTTTGAFLSPLLLPATPGFLAIDPVNGFLYADNYSTQVVMVINTSDGAVVASLPVGTQPLTITYDPAADAMLVADRGSDQLTVLNATTNSLAGNVTAPEGPWGVAYDPENRDLYVTDYSAGNSSWSWNCTGLVSVYQGYGSFSPGQNIWVGYQPTGIAYDPDNDEIYVANTFECGVVAINGTTNGVMAAFLPPPAELLGILVPWFVTVDPGTDRIFVSVTEIFPGLDGYVMVIDGQTDQELANVLVGSQVMDVVDDPALGEVLTSDPVAMTITEIDVNTLNVSNELFAGTEPGPMLYDPVDGIIYVLDPPARAVFEVSGATDRVVGYVDVGEEAHSLAYDPVTGNVFVSLFYESTIEELNITTNTASWFATDNYLTSMPALGDWPAGLAFSQTTDLLFDSEAFPHKLTESDFAGVVEVHNGTTGVLVDLMDLCGIPDGSAVASDPLTGTLYLSATGPGGTYVSAIDPATLSETACVRINDVNETNRPGYQLGNDSVAFDPGNGDLYAADFDASTVSILSTPSNLSVLGSIAVPAPTATFVDPELGDVVVASDNGTVTIVNGTTLAPEAVVHVGSLPDGIASDPRTGQLLVANNASGSLAILDEPTTPNPITVSLSATPPSVPLGGNLTLTAMASGGSGALSYAYFGLPAGCRSGNLSVLRCQPGEVGTFTVTLGVHDPFDRSAVASLRLQVLPEEYPIVFSESGLTSGTYWYAEVAGTTVGSAGTTITFDEANGSHLFGVDPVPGYSVSIPPSSSILGSGLLEVSGGPATIAVVFTGLHGPAPLAISTFEAYPAEVLAGNVTLLAVGLLNATGPTTFTYAGLPPGCVSANSSVLSCRPAQAGTFEIRVNVTEAGGGSTNATTELVVLPEASVSPSMSSPGTLTWELTAGLASAAAAIGTAVGILVGTRRGQAARPATSNVPGEPKT